MGLRKIEKYVSFIEGSKRGAIVGKKNRKRGRLDSGKRTHKVMLSSGQIWGEVGGKLLSGLHNGGQRTVRKEGP